MKKRGFFKRAICGLLIVASVTSVIAFTYSSQSPVQAETIEELQKKQEEMKKQQEEYQKQEEALKKQQEELQKQQQDLNKKQDAYSEEEKSQNSKKDELNTEKNKTQAEKEELERQLEKLLAELDLINKKADELVVNIGIANSELETQQQNSEIQYQDMKLRIQYMYENQGNSIKQSLITSEDMGEFLNAADYYQKIYDYDRNKLEEIAQTIKKIEELTEKLNIELAEVEEVQKQMYAKENEINDLVSTKADIISELDSSIASAAQAAAEAAQARKEAEDEEARLAAQEKKLVEEADKAAAAAEQAASEAAKAAAEEQRIREEQEARRRAAEEAARRAAEEAARKAAEEQAARDRAAAQAAEAQRVANSSASSSTSSSSSSGSYSYSEPAASSNYTVTENTTSGLAQRIATNARNNNGWYPATAGMCAMWVAGIYAQSGAGRPYGNAIEYWNKWSWSGSTSKSNIPVGAAVISSGAGVLAATYGHIGIYLGDGMVASNIGGVKIESIDSFDRGATATCQGHRGYIGWVWPNGVALN